VEFLDAAIAVLRKEGEPLHWTKIQDLALRRGYLDPFEQKDIRRNLLAALADGVRSGALAKVSKGVYELGPNDRIEDIGSDVLAVLADGTEPLYSAFAYVNREHDGSVALRDFLKLVDDLAQSAMVRVWQWDDSQNELVEIGTLPPDALDEYETQEHEDPTYDPTGLALSLGPLGEKFESRKWRLRIDWRAENYVLNTEGNSLQEALRDASRVLGVIFEEVTRHEEHGRIEVRGRILTQG
jgi:hypothetical protein